MAGKKHVHGPCIRAGDASGVRTDTPSRYILPTRYFAVYYPTPQPIIDRMLRLASVSHRDVLMDLGCGDGRGAGAGAGAGAGVIELWACYTCVPYMI